VLTKPLPDQVYHIFTGAQASEQLDKTIEWMQKNHIRSRKERMEAIEFLIDCYISQTGERPDPVQLERLTDMTLHEELTDPRKNKVQAEEYPFFSETQLSRRRNGTHQRKDGSSREVGLNQAAEVGTDGRNYRKPTRRKLTTHEMIHVDERAKIRNKERRKRYREATRPGPVVTYFIEKMQ
jgi:hypothetical protein